MLCIVDTEGSKLANLHYLLLLHQATVTFSALKRERHLSPQLCWLECWTGTSSDWTKNKWSTSQSVAVNKVLSSSVYRHKLRREETFGKAIFIYIRGRFYMRKTNTAKYRNVCDIPVFTEASSLLYFCLICVWSVIQLNVDFSQDSKRWSVLTASRPNKTVDKASNINIMIMQPHCMQ